MDDINFSKTQIIESLNSLLKTNIKYNVKYNKNYKYSIIQKREDKEINITDKNKSFDIIVTMK